MKSVIPSDRLAYLATAYSKYVRGLAAAYHDAAELAGRLLLAGIKVYSPIVHSHPLAMHSQGALDPLDTSIWYPLNDLMLSKCDILIVGHLQGWDESEGVAGEVQYFEGVWKPIYDCDPRSLTLSRRELGPKEHAEPATA